MTKERSSVLFKNVLSQGASATLNQLLNLLTIPLLLRTVSPTDFGAYALGTAFVGYLSILNISSRIATVKFVAEHDHDELNILGQLVSASLLINLCAGLIMMIGLGGIGLFPEMFLSIDTEDITTTRTVLLIYAAAVPIRQLLSVFGSYLLGRQEYEWVSLLDILGSLIRAATIVFIFTLNGTILWLVIQEVSYQILRGAALAVVFKRRYPQLRFSVKRADRTVLRTVLGYGGWSTLDTIATIFAYQGLRLLIGILVSVSAVTYFHIAYMAYNLVNTVSLYLGNAVLPASSSALAQGEIHFLNKLLDNGTRTSLAILLPIAITLLIYSKPIIQIWLGDQYVEPAHPLTVILIASWIFRAWVVILTRIYLGQRKISAMAISNFVLTAIELVLASIFIVSYGVDGVAWAAFIYHSTLSPIQAVIAAKQLHFDIRPFLYRSVLPLYGVNLLFGSLTFSAYTAWGGPESPVLLLFAVPATIAVGVTLSFALAAQHEARFIVTQLRRGLGGILAARLDK